MSDRNRAILLTGPGAAAIAVVRLAGPAVGGFLRAHFSRVAAPGRAVHGLLTEGARVIDDPVVVLGRDETYADVNLHGGPWVVRSFLELASREGFETIEEMCLPLPLDATDGGSVLDREIEAYLPLAKTEMAVRVLLAQADAWRGFCGRGIDREGIGAILADQSLCWLLSPPRVAIIGVPNVGKSTLANQLFAQERSITADLPGTTRDWVGEIANLDGLAVMLMDTPGVHEAIDPIERQAIEQSGQEVCRSDLVVLVLDATQPLAGGQSRLMRRYSDALLVINKCDRVSAWDIESVPGVRTVGTTGQGVDQLRSAIRGRFGCEGMERMRPRFWTPRQKKILQRSLEDPTLVQELIL